VFLFVKINQLQILVLNIYMETNTITISDLDTVKNIINLASTRGAFRGEELSMVGTVYDKLTAFLEAVIEQAKAQEANNAVAGETQGE
jgi:hypothetical protein